MKSGSTKHLKPLRVSLLIFFGVLFVHLSSWAQWTAVMHKDKRAEYMVDVKLVTSNFGNLVVPTLINYKDEQIGADGQPYFSTISAVEYDCSGNRSRQLFIKTFSENLGLGKIVGNFDSKSDWKRFGENDHALILQNMICKR